MISVPPLSAMMSSIALHAGVLALCSVTLLSTDNSPTQNIEVSLVLPSEYQNAVQKDYASQVEAIPVLTTAVSNEVWASSQKIAYIPAEISPHIQPFIQKTVVSRQHRLTTGKPARAATQLASVETMPIVQAQSIHNPAPQYPQAQRKEGVQGRVLLSVDVLHTGEPRSVNIAQSSGNEQLDSAARSAVRQWRFMPAKRGDAAVASRVIVPVEFKLN